MIVQALFSLWTSCGPAMADHLWQSTVVVALAMVLAFALRKNSARVRHRVWLAASMKFLVPFSLLIALGGHFAKPRVNTTTQAVVYSAVEQVSQPFAVYEEPVVQHGAIAQSAVERLHLIPVAVVTVWLCGIVVVLLMWGRAWLRVSRIVRGAVAMTEGHEVDALRKLELQLGLRKPIKFVMSQDWMEPGIFGVFRPVLIWPGGISEHLNERHLRAIVAHELCHVRRRDNLAAVLHMLVEAIFWFHPLVWWMGRKLEEEREAACDEEVTLLFEEPGVYAESILKVCKFCSESPLACVSGITGADLKKRVVQIMKGRVTSKLGLGRRVLLLAVGLSVVTVPILMGQAKAAQRMMVAVAKTMPLPRHSTEHAAIVEEHSSLTQQAAQDAPNAPDAAANAELADVAKGPAFEVAVIRPANQSIRRYFIGTTVDAAGKFETSAASLNTLVYAAYIQGDMKRVTGGPAWAQSDTFDINAKVDDAYMSGWDKLSGRERMDRARPMLRRLLAERFHLKLRVEMQQAPVYALVQARGGTRMKEVPAPVKAEGDPMEAFKRQIKEHPGIPLPGTILCGRGTCTGSAVPMSHAVSQIAGSSHANRIVIDETGLKGYYDFTMTQPGPDDPAAMSEIEDDLGLRFVSRKMPVQTYVIESAEKPSLDGAGVDSNPQTSSNGDGLSGRLVEAKFTQAVQDGSANLPKMVFDVVSIRPSPPDAHVLSALHGTPENFSASMATVESMIGYAYQIPYTLGMSSDPAHFFLPHSQDLSGGPAWISTDKYDLTAKADAATVQAWNQLPEKEQKEELRRMMRVVLEERFHLTMRHETREMPVWLLVVAKGGPKFAATAGPPAGLNDGVVKPFDQSKPYTTRWKLNRGLIQGTDVSISDFATMLWNHRELDSHKIIDQTGLKGMYDLTLKWASVDDPQVSDGPALFTAIQEQLGLKLEAAKRPLDVTVVDHVEKPSEN